MSRLRQGFGAQGAATRLVVLTLAGVMVCAFPSLALAQVASTAAQKPSSHPVELAVGGLVSGETSYGSLDAEFITNSGGRLTVFRTESALRPGFGLEVDLGIGLTRSLAIEASGGWTRADFRTRISSDLEEVADAVLKEHLTRYSVEGAALWTFARRGKSSWFARGGAGWMRDLTGNDSLVEDGILGSFGIGVKYLWNQAAQGGLRVTGFRVEGRALAHKRGLTIGDDKLRLTPAVSGSLIFGF
ncbi:MAG TPA: hypothetical protein VES67_07790 [Vicinamibacterales bacterium]|nr:hypothetical protein [Vicinamibacterales bacterium]